MIDILFAWLGNTDIKSLSNQNPDDLGPIAQAIKNREYTHLVLLSNYEEKLVNAYIPQLKKLFTCVVIYYPGGFLSRVYLWRKYGKKGKSNSIKCLQIQPNSMVR